MMRCSQPKAADSDRDLLSMASLVPMGEPLARACSSGDIATRYMPHVGRSAPENPSSMGLLLARLEAGALRLARGRDPPQKACHTLVDEYCSHNQWLGLAKRTQTGADQVAVAVGA
jgi:hypothetical protein